MTLLARHTKRVPGSPVLIRRACFSFEKRGVTLQTTRHDRAAEIQRPVSVTWTVDPACDLRPVRDRQLEELILFSPVEISLSLSSGANNEIEPFGDGDRVGWCSEYADLEEAIRFGFHAVLELALCSQNIFAGSKTTGNRVCVCRL